MRRNKSVKRANKRQTMNNTLASVQKMEMDWVQTPSKLAAQLDKEINAHKKQGIKLEKTISKLDNALLKSEARIAKAAKNKYPTAANKKQIKSVQKEHSANSKALALSIKQFEAVTKALDAVVAKQAKLIALSKYVSQFEKEWNKSAKAAKAKAKPQQTKAEKSNKRKLAVVDSQMQSADTALDDNRLEEVAELAS